MASKKVEIQRYTRKLRLKEGRDVTSHEIAAALKADGWKMPEPKSPLDILAKEISDALREETRFDEVIAKPYHANVCYTEKRGDKQQTFWADIDRVDRRKMVKNITLRRDQMVGDATQITIDAMHWNRINPTLEPVQIELDMGPDVEWNLNAPTKKRSA